MEELYKKYSIGKSKRINNVINKDLIFKFNGHHINRIYIVVAIVSIIAIVYVEEIFYFLYLIFFLIMVIFNKMSIYTVYFDTQNIIIKNSYKKHIICYKNGIELYINKGKNADFRRHGIMRRLSKLITLSNESDNEYSLILQANYDIFVLVTVVNDDIVKEITRFIDNFYFDENIKNEQRYIRLQRN